MVCPIRENKDRIEEYCKKNDLDINKLKSLKISYNDKTVFFQHCEKTKEHAKLDDTPAPIVLEMRMVDSDIVFIQNENTIKSIGKGHV